MGGGCFPPPKLPQYPRNADAENVPASPSLLPIVPDSPQTGSSAGLPWLERPCNTSTVPQPGERLSNSISPLSLAHAASSCAPPSTQTPSPPRTPYTAPVPSAAPDRKVHLSSSVSHMPPTTGSRSPGMGGRPCRLSFRHWSSGPHYQTVRPGY